jgi:hypothetical protein
VPLRVEGPLGGSDLGRQVRLVLFLVSCGHEENRARRAVGPGAGPAHPSRAASAPNAAVRARIALLHARAQRHHLISSARISTFSGATGFRAEASAILN